MSTFRNACIIGLSTTLLVACGSATPAAISPVETLTNPQVPPTIQPSEAVPTSEPTDPPPVPDPTASLASQPSVSLGLARAEAANFFEFLEFAFELESTSSGDENYKGTLTDGLATVHILGPEDAITSISVVIEVPTPPTENQSARTIAYLAAVLSVAAEDWPDGTDWLNESLNIMGESRATFDGREALLLLEPAAESMYVELTVVAVP